MLVSNPRPFSSNAVIVIAAAVIIVVADVLVVIFRQRRGIEMIYEGEEVIIEGEISVEGEVIGKGDNLGMGASVAPVFGRIIGHSDDVVAERLGRGR